MCNNSHSGWWNEELEKEEQEFDEPFDFEMPFNVED